MFSLMGKKITTILRSKYLLNWTLVIMVRSQLILIYSVFKGVCQGSAGQGMGDCSDKLISNLKQLRLAQYDMTFF